MALLKCKMCGGDIELSAEKTFGTCEYCGSTMTFPKVDDDQRAAAFNRGNHFRRIGEFDKALAVYERIVREDDTDAEAHWCCALCRFGIEYVEDPATLEYLPTCHRASFDSFLEDVDYLAAVVHSDGITRRQYKKDGAKIAEVQRGILATSQNETPFDVFICYKESDDNGQRTRDSLMAQDVYYQLTDRGYRVFFSRITLEDIGGKQYEPYIFAALNSAKVMIVIGTKPEHMNAVWVKNEWSRFLAMMKKDRNKLLLPCYRDMDPYDMPEQLSVLQSYDMSKIGFIQDLVRGIQKVLDAKKKMEVIRETVTVHHANSNIVALLKRGNMALEDSEWDKADQFFEEVLNQDAECAEAYLGKLMAELHARKQESLKDTKEPLDGNGNYQKAVRFADEKLRTTLRGYNEHIQTRNENAHMESVYNQAKRELSAAITEEAYINIAKMFETVRNYKDSAALAQACYESAEAARKDAVLSWTKTRLHKQIPTIKDMEETIAALKNLSGYKNAEDLISSCEAKIKEIQEKAEKKCLEIAQKAAERAARRKKFRTFAITIACLSVVFAIAFYAVIMPIYNSSDAVRKRNAAIEKFGEEFVAIFENLEVGDIFTFGNYEQDNNTKNGKEKIKWIVLADEGTRILVVSKYALDQQLYSGSAATADTWKTSTLRNWLNTSFYQKAFSNSERAIIATVTVERNTQDKVFLLSIEEVRKYLGSGSTYLCQPTDYAAACGVLQNDNGNCNWWLRSSENLSTDAPIVTSDGRINTTGFVYLKKAVRPAMWIDLNAT